MNAYLLPRSEITCPYRTGLLSHQLLEASLVEGEDIVEWIGHVHVAVNVTLYSVCGVISMVWRSLSIAHSQLRDLLLDCHARKQVCDPILNRRVRVLVRRHAPVIIRPARVEGEVQVIPYAFDARCRKEPDNPYTAHNEAGRRYRGPCTYVTLYVYALFSY